MSVRKYVLASLTLGLYRQKVGVEVSSQVIYEGNIPKNTDNIKDFNPAAFAIINNRKRPEGDNPIRLYTTGCRLGAGCGLVIENPNEAFDWPRDYLKEKFSSKLGNFGPSALVCMVRDLAAGGTWLCLDLAAGAVEIKDIVAAALLELIELGFYKEDGWARFILPEQYSDHQAIFDAAQSYEWERLEPGFPCKYEIRLSSIMMQGDALGGESCVISADSKEGVVEFIFSFSAKLEGRGWRVRDTEYSSGEGNAFALNRQVKLVMQAQSDQPPLVFSLDSNGGIDTKSLVIPLEGTALRMCANEKVITMLSALNWIKSD